MIVLSIFEAIGSFFTNIVFAPLHVMRHMDSWWGSNVLNLIFVLIGFAFFFYWVGQSFKFKREGTEDVP